MTMLDAMLEFSEKRIPTTMSELPLKLLKPIRQMSQIRTCPRLHSRASPNIGVTPAVPTGSNSGGWILKKKVNVVTLFWSSWLASFFRRSHFWLFCEIFRPKYFGLIVRTFSGLLFQCSDPDPEKLDWGRKVQNGNRNNKQWYHCRE